MCQKNSHLEFDAWYEANKEALTSLGEVEALRKAFEAGKKCKECKKLPIKTDAVSPFICRPADRKL